MALLDKAGLERFWAHVVSLVGTKVEKEDGKGLSTEDFTTEEKEKLAGIAEGATNTIIANNVTSTSTTEALSAAQGKYLNDRISAITGDMENLGGGDMMRATYDANRNDVVDKAEALADINGNLIDSGSTTNPIYFKDGIPVPITHTLGTSVPSDAKFTDTVYTLPVATSSELGGVKSGTDITIDASGNVSVNDDSHNHKVSNISDLTVSATELNYVDGVTSSIQAQLDAKALASDVTMKVYGNLSDIGLTPGVTMDEVIAALPINSIIYIAPSSLTEDLVWWFPASEGIIEIMKKDDHISVTFYGGAGGEIWIAKPMGHGMFSGSWDKLAKDSELGKKQATITGGATTITNANLTVNRALISDDNGKVAVSAVTSTELNYLDGVTSAIQTQLDTKALAADVTMKVYKNITDIGMTTASTFADVVAAVPMHAVIYIAAGALTDSSWSLPVTYGVIEIIRKGETQVAIRLHGRVGRVWIAATTTAGVPTGEWNELIRESALNSELAKKLGNSGDQEITNGSLKITSTSDTALRLDKTIDASNYVREYMILEADRARVGFGKNGTIGNQISLYEDRTVLTQPLTVASGGTGATTAEGALTNLGITATADELNKLDGVTATTAELNKLAGLKPTKSELDYVDGVTSNIQDQLDDKVSSDGSIPMTDKLTINRATYPGVTLNETTVGSRSVIQNYGHSVVLDMFNAAGDDTNRRSLLLRDNSVDTLATAIRLRDKNSTEDKYYDIYGEHNIEASMTELGYVKGVKDSIQDQLDAKQATITGAASSIVSSDFSNTDVVLISNSNGKVSSTSGVTKTELQTLQGVTRNLATTMTNLGSNIIDTSTNDTPAKWSELGSGYAYFSSTGRLVNQPTQYGIVVSNVVGAMVFQFFAANSGTGSVYVRYGNSSGWRYNWSKLMDDRKFEFDSSTATLNITL